MIKLLKRLFRKKRPELPRETALDSQWRRYQEWCESRICIGGCRKRARDRHRDVDGVCTVPWITEECCWECWESGKSTGRSNESDFLGSGAGFHGKPTFSHGLI